MPKEIRNKKVLIIGISVLVILSGFSFMYTFMLSSHEISSQEMIKTLSYNDQISFKNINWLSTKEQVLKHEGIKDAKVLKSDKDYSKDYLFIESPKLQTFKGSNLKVHTQYTFYVNKFIIGKYCIYSNKEKDFKNIVDKLVSEITQKYGNPEGKYNAGPTEIPLSGSADNGAQWRDKKRDYLTIIISNNTKPPMPYKLEIRVSSPLEIQSGSIH